MLENTQGIHRRIRRDGKNRPGLTLIELVVVLTILTALGGLLVPVIGNVLQRTHFAKCAATIPDITRQISRSFAQDLRYPNGWDSLIAEGGGLASAILPPGLATNGELQVVTLTADQAAGLRSVGITEVVDLDDTLTSGVTWEAAELGKAARALETGEEVVVLDNDGESVEILGLKRHLSDPDVIYIVFGIGQNSTAVGTGGLFVEAPIHFGAEDELNPSDVYQRYVAIFSVDGDGDLRFEQAAAMHNDAIEGAQEHVIEFWEDTRRG